MKLKLSPDVARLNNLGSTLDTAPSRRKSKAGTGDGEYINRLMAAAANGWTCLHSPDGVRYRWTAPGGIVSPWGTYAEATAYGAAHAAPTKRRAE